MGEKKEQKFIVKLWKEEHAVCLQVMAMPDDVIEGIGPIFKAKNRWSVHTQTNPSILVQSKEIYLRGTGHNEDWTVASGVCVDNKERDEAYVQIKAAFQEFADIRRPKGGGAAADIQGAIEIALANLHEVLHQGDLGEGGMLKRLKLTYKELLLWYDRSTPRFKDGEVWEW